MSFLRRTGTQDQVEFIGIQPKGSIWKHKMDGSLWGIVAFVKHAESGKDLALAYEVPDSGVWLYRSVNGITDIIPEGQPLLADYRDFQNTHVNLDNGSILAGE